MQTDVASSTSPLLSREFGVYLVLQELEINLSQFDQPSLGSGFTDVPEDSFFAPYITFARDVGMVRGYAE